MLTVASSQHFRLQLVNTSLEQIESFLLKYLHFSLPLQNRIFPQINIYELPHFIYIFLFKIIVSSDYTHISQLYNL
jgi:hypothetical protein